MDSTGAQFTLDLPRLVLLALVIAGGLIVAAAYWRRQRPTPLATANRRTLGLKPHGIVYNDSPTVRVTDSQRVDRIRKVARLAIGEHLDVLETRIGPTPRFRITLQGIVRTDDSTAAHIFVEFGGTAVSCGPLVEEVAFNEFVLPRAARDEPRNSVFYYQENGDTLDFMRVKLRGVDMDADIAEIDVMQVSGHWPSG